MKPIDFPSEIMNIKQSGGGITEDFATVTFMNGNEEIYSRPVYIGDDCPDPVTQGRIETPTKESTVDTVYTHNGWTSTDGGTANSNILKNIQADTVVYSAFQESERLYTIRFLDGESVRQILYMPYNSIPNPDMPTHSTDPDHYAFDSWSPTISKVTGDMDYTVIWKEKIALYDYTWEEINAMPLEEMREKFKVGDKAPIIDNTAINSVLLGFENMELADGSGKARMTIGVPARMYPSIASLGVIWGDNKDWATCSYRGADAAAYHQKTYPDILTYGKPVKVKYTATDGTLKETTDIIFTPSLSQLGYTDVVNEGDKFDFFTEKTITEPLEDMGWLYGIDTFTRTLEANSGKVYCIKSKTAPHLELRTERKAPYIVFCI